MPGKVKVTAETLRLLAESVDGSRGETVYIVVRDGELKPVRRKNDGEEELFLCETPLHRPQRPPVEHLRIRVRGKETSLHELCDSVFWTESAVEKFVVPYYAGVGGADAAMDVWTAFNDESVYALVHLPRSTYEAMSTGFEPLGVVTDIRKGLGGLEVIPLSEFMALR